MPILKDYQQFSGRHPETGSVHNVLAYQGVTAPHTGLPYSEAFLLGVSGGIAFGYFTFDYQGYDPILALIFRNTFDPLQTMLERIGIPQTVLQTANRATAEKNLMETLTNGRPALVWVDFFSLPYNGLQRDEKNWNMMPVVVYGLEDGVAYLADRSGQPLHVPAGVLSDARARVKKDKFRLITLDPPDDRKLTSAVQQGIWQCIRLFTEKPPKGSRDNFGFAALQKWANMLTNRRNPQSWERFFPPGPRMLAALAGNAYLPGAYVWITQRGTQADADRSAYADFLDEAAILLEKPGLREVVERFRKSGLLWQAFAAELLPDDQPLLGEARRLKDRRHKVFLEEGSAAEPQIREINARLEAMREDAGRDFPMSVIQSRNFLAGLREHVLTIHDVEKEAIEGLQEVMS